MRVGPRARPDAGETATSRARLGDETTIGRLDRRTKSSVKLRIRADRRRVLPLGEHLRERDQGIEFGAGSKDDYELIEKLGPTLVAQVTSPWKGLGHGGNDLGRPNVSGEVSQHLSNRTGSYQLIGEEIRSSEEKVRGIASRDDQPMNMVDRVGDALRFPKKLPQGESLGDGHGLAS